MSSHQLKLYIGPDDCEMSDEEFDFETRLQQPVVATKSLSLCELLPMLSQAILTAPAWLEDFEEDEVTISADLHDVLQAYCSFRTTA